MNGCLLGWDCRWSRCVSFIVLLVHDACFGYVLRRLMSSDLDVTSAKVLLMAAA